jgi:hypothetical protein
MAGAIALSRAVSDVARDHAGELTEVNRGLQGFLSGAEREAALSIAGKLTK